MPLKYVLAAHVGLKLQPRKCWRNMLKLTSQLLFLPQRFQCSPVGSHRTWLYLSHISAVLVKMCWGGGGGADEGLVFL